MENQTTQEEVVNTTTDTTTTQTNQTKKPDMRIYQVFVGIIAIIAVVVGTMWYMGKNPPAPKPVAIQQVAPDTVLAVVNGEEITQADIDRRIQDAGQALAAQGINISDPAVRAQIQPQVLEDTINYTLLKQNAEKEGVVADQNQLDTTFQAIVDQAGGVEQLDTQLAQAGLTSEELKQQLHEQLQIDVYLSQNIALDDVTVSDEEIQTFYNQAAAQMGDTAPPLEDVKEQIVQQLTNQKKQELINTFALSLRENADINIQ